MAPQLLSLSDGTTPPPPLYTPHSSRGRWLFTLVGQGFRSGFPRPGTDCKGAGRGCTPPTSVRCRGEDFLSPPTTEETWRKPRPLDSLSLGPVTGWRERERERHVVCYRQTERWSGPPPRPPYPASSLIYTHTHTLVHVRTVVYSYSARWIRQQGRHKYLLLSLHVLRAVLRNVYVFLPPPPPPPPPPPRNTIMQRPSLAPRILLTCKAPEQGSNERLCGF